MTDDDPEDPNAALSRALNSNQDGVMVLGGKIKFAIIESVFNLGFFFLFALLPSLTSSLLSSFCCIFFWIWICHCSLSFSLL
jgi:hypothetical protein